MVGWRTLLVLWTVVALACHPGRRRAPVQLPQIVVWAWDRAEDLRFLGERPGHDVGVAYLAATIVIAGDRVARLSRGSALALPENVPAIPVVRIEADLGPPSILGESQRAELRRLLASEVRGGALQIDFEARASERDFYRRLLVELRNDLGPQVGLSVTALASFCLGDRWMADLPVDEIVPMFYRLGAEGRRLRAALRSGVDLASECRAAHGLILDEPMVLPPTPRRLYLFSPTAWREESLERTLARLAAKPPEGR